jgi:hypothetical protein
MKTRILVEEKANGAALIHETWQLIPEATPGTKTGRTYLARFIDAGEGSSAFYTPEVLKQAATDRIFAEGTRIHLDHPRRSDDRELPERSVKDWCAVFAADAVYNETAQALEAPIRVFAPYQALIAEMWEQVGMSIRAWADTEPTPSGKPKIVRFTEAGSVDFVTQAGRGGKLLEVLESRMVEATYRDRRDQIETAVKGQYQTDQQYVWVRDFDDTQVWFETDEGHCWQQTYQIAADDLSVSLTGDAVEVRPVVQYVPVKPEGETESNKEATMPQIDEAKLAELTAAADRVSTLEAQLAEKDNKIAEKDQALKAHDNSLLAGKALATVEGFDKLPELAQARVAEQLSKSVPTNEAGDFDGEKFNTVAVEAVKQEADYLAKVAPVNEHLHGFGDSHPATEGTGKRTRDAWGDKKKEH